MGACTPPSSNAIPILRAEVAPPAAGARRSASQVGKSQRSHVISFPQITDTGGDEDEVEDEVEGGLGNGFRWHADEFWSDM